MIENISLVFVLVLMVVGFSFSTMMFDIQLTAYLLGLAIFLGIFATYLEKKGLW